MIGHILDEMRRHDRTLEENGFEGLGHRAMALALADKLASLEMTAARNAQRERIEAALQRDRSQDIDTTDWTDEEFAAFIDRF